MLQYIIIILDDTSTSFCHFECNKENRKLIDIEDLKAGIFYAMKENLMIQFVYPDYELPLGYKEVINKIDHSVIVSSSCHDKSLIREADAIVLNGWEGIGQLQYEKDTAYVLRTTKSELFKKYELLLSVLENVDRLNIVITDVEKFSDEDGKCYKEVLASLSESLERLYIKGNNPQVNILTDRILLDCMNNCNAGCESITLAPDGNFYICPAFYFAEPVDKSESSIAEACEKGYSVGNLILGLDIKNAQLYQLDHAPICRNCDAYQCKRCVWLNRKMTCEVNTPSHEQCVVSHIERNASRLLLNNIRKHGSFLPEKEEIKVIDYLDPFDKRDEW